MPLGTVKGRMRLGDGEDPDSARGAGVMAARRPPPLRGGPRRLPARRARARTRCARFERHLEGCARCQADERWLRAAVEMLPSSVEQFEPPPALRERLMDTRPRRGARATRTACSARRRAALALARLRCARRPRAARALLRSSPPGVAGYLIGDDGGGATTTTIQAEATRAEPTARGERRADGRLARCCGSIGLPVQRPGPRLRGRGSSADSEDRALVALRRRTRTGRARRRSRAASTASRRSWSATSRRAAAAQPTTEPVLIAKL